MKLFECCRYSDEEMREAMEWKGALLIAASNSREAIEIFKKNEYDEEPKNVEEFWGISVEGDPRVIYNDESR